MPIARNTSNLLLFVGDIILFSASLYLTLVVRYGELPGPTLLTEHFTAFSVLFIVWVLVFFVAGLYDKQTLLFPESLWQRILRTLIINSFIAVVFFYTIPFFSITPKTNLFIYLVISFGLIAAWRYWASTLLGSRNPVQAILITAGNIGDEIQERIETSESGLKIKARINPEEYHSDRLYQEVQDIINKTNTSFVILDMQHPVVQRVLSRLYNLLYTNIHFISIDTLYETLFERVPITRLQHEWFIEHIRQTPHVAYDILKRGMDIVISTALFILSLLLYPFIALAIWLQDRGPVFYRQKRIGQYGEEIEITKFRTMTTLKEAGREDKKQVTTVGRFLRKTRLDELPQLIDVLQGDLSLIGPRPEIPSIISSYEEDIPYYNARHLIKPGLSGWAQLRHDNPPKFTAEIQKTRRKLSYDLYYVKNRSLLLDIKIALWTLRVLASRSGK